MLSAIQLLAALALAQDPAGAERVEVLLVTGDDEPGHLWPAKAATLAEVIGRDTRCEVRVLDDAEELGSGALDGVDVVVWSRVDWTGPPLTETSRAALRAWTEGGGGIALIHFANGAHHRSLPGGPEHHWDWWHGAVSLRSWDHEGPSGHDGYAPFVCEVSDLAHPITEGMTQWTTVDELYHSQAGSSFVRALVVARSAQTRRDEPMAWTHHAGEGRVFQTLLGHAPASIRSGGTARLIQRGVVWAAGARLVEVEHPNTPFGAAPGRFGSALDARAGPVVVPRDGAFVGPPLTVECWAKLESKSGFSVLVSNEEKQSSTHWELYAFAGPGDLSVHMPGFAPSEIRSGVPVADGQWHHCAFTFDGVEVALFVDGEEAHRAAVERVRAEPGEAGPLRIGAAVAADHQVGCDGLVDEVRVLRVVAPPRRLPTEAPKRTEQTVGLWSLDEGTSSFVPDPAWTPRGSTAPGAAAFERETDESWVDDRFARMDPGPFFSGSIQTPGVPDQGLTTRGVAVGVGDGAAGAMLFDTQLLRWSAGWLGPLVKTSPVRFGLLKKPSIGGEPLIWHPEEPGWAMGEGGQDRAHAPPPFEDPRPNPWVPLPADRARFEGLYRHGDRVVLSYTVGDLAVLESPWLVMVGEQPVFVRDLLLGASVREQALALPPGGEWSVRSPDGSTRVTTASTGGRHAIHLDPGAPERLRVLVSPQPIPDSLDLDVPDLASWTRGGPRRWGDALRTRGELGEDEGGLALDTLTLPHDNPFGALLFASGIGFLPDGRAAVCTIHGDVWLVAGIDEDLDELRWQRFATGLYQPLGLEVVDGEVIVLGRDRLTRLRDLDGDGEADLYESFCDLLEVTGADHHYAMDLARGPDGWLYFNKSGNTSTEHGGAVIRVSADGRTLERVASGRRHANGVGVSPWGVVTSADNEGEWVPATRIDVVEPDGFYGYAPAFRGTGQPRSHDPPLLWLPREADNSAGGQVWVPDDRWVPGLDGRMLHLSYGRCRALLVGGQEVGGGIQGWAVTLPPTFLSGSMRARFSPGDGQLYVAGSDGWQTAARADGSLQRVRATGGELTVPTRVELQPGGVWLDFSTDLDASSVLAPGAFGATRWDYRWGSRYGSDDWSVTAPEQTGRDSVAIETLNFTQDGRRVFLRLESIVPCMQMAIDFDLLTLSGATARGTVWMTILEVPEGGED